MLTVSAPDALVDEILKHLLGHSWNAVGVVRLAHLVLDLAALGADARVVTAGHEGDVGLEVLTARLYVGRRFDFGEGERAAIGLLALAVGASLVDGWEAAHPDVCRVVECVVMIAKRLRLRRARGLR